MPDQHLTIALAGNPNSGKTTIFNAITGTRHKVGNWPGVTVEKKEGTVIKFGRKLKIVDLPGTYSLTPFSIEEIVARDFILNDQPDVVIDIIDSSNLERSLYLAIQLRELGSKVVFALNMADQARARGIKIDAEKLGQLLGVPVVFTVGNKGQGIDELLKKAVELALSGKEPEDSRNVKYTGEIESAIEVLQEALGDLFKKRNINVPLRWTAIKLIEDDRVAKERLVSLLGKDSESVLEEARRQRDYITGRYNEDPEILTTDDRFGFISGIIKETVTTTSRHRVDISRNIDLLLTNRFLGLPIFFFFIWAMFQLTFALGQYPMYWLEEAVNGLSNLAAAVLPTGLLKNLLVDGVIAGVGAVIVFLPNILILFFCIALFEDTGYMARAAFLMDKIMHMIGLHGKSFIPMLMGFGCNVPAIMATRTLESRTDRILTILITPFMSCSAKLPVYIVLAGAFFGPKAGSVIFGIYMTGIVLSVVTGRLFRSTLFRGADAPFVMELPPYRAPMLKSLIIHMWDRSKIFLKKMGGIIMIGSIIIWALSNFPQDPRLEQEYRSLETKLALLSEQVPPVGQNTITELEKMRKQLEAERTSYSFIGRIGRAVAPVFKPLGVDWRGGVALLTGFVAKEIVVSTLGVLHSVGDQNSEALQKSLRRSGMSPAGALAMMVFVLLYLPCLATVGAIARETGSAGWMWFSIAYNTTIAWIVAFLVYQAGKFIGLG